jgi:hypothetical protein
MHLSIYLGWVLIDEGMRPAERNQSKYIYSLVASAADKNSLVLRRSYDQHA